LKKGSGYMAPKHVAFAPGNKWGQINGDRPHFLRKGTFSCRKWGLSPFIPERLTLLYTFLTKAIN